MPDDPYGTFLAGHNLYLLGRVVADVVCWCEYPDPESLTDDWLQKVKDRLQDPLSGFRRAHPNHPDGERALRLAEDAARTAAELATVVRSTHTLARQSYHAWESEHRRRQCDNLARVAHRLIREGECVSEFRELPEEDEDPDAEGLLRDGLVGAHGFRFRGQEIEFRRAPLRRRLMEALWDSGSHHPHQFREIGDVIDHVYQEAADEPKVEGRFNNLLVEVRQIFCRRIPPIPLSITRDGGRVWLAPLPG